MSLDNKKFIDSKNGYRIRFIDKEKRELPSDIDLSCVVKSNNGYWAKRIGEREELGSKVYYSPDKKNWYPAYKDKKTSHSTQIGAKTQVGKIIYRARVNGKVLSIGKNILTWYTANNISRVNYNKEIDHVNGDYTDDRLSNLERVTPSENIKRRIQMQLAEI
jgi:hypothetical protein